MFRPANFFLLAGEPSGDLLGARLIRSLRQLRPDATFRGVGGDRMQAEGLQSLFAMDELTHFGIFEIWRHVPNLLRRIREVADEVKKTAPTAFISIDVPGFSFSVARKLAGSGVPRIHMVAPTVWAWRPERTKKVAALYDHLLTLLPFEPAYFEKENLRCTFIGHPVLENGADKGDGAAFIARHNLAPEKPILILLPGSRRSEWERLLPIMAETLNRLGVEWPELQIVLPTLPACQKEMRERIRDWPHPITLVAGDQDKHDAFAAGTVALAASGTVAVELALAGLPSVIAYKLHPLTYLFYRRLIKVKYVSLPNLLLDRETQPECLQTECTPERLAREVGTLLADPEKRQAQKAALRLIAPLLTNDTGESPSMRAAKAILTECEHA